MRALKDESERPAKLYEASFYCTLLLHASSQREAIQQVMAIAQRNHLKIEDGVSDGLHVFRHRPNGMLSKSAKSRRGKS
jgi:hypothetical protein